MPDKSILHLGKYITVLTSSTLVSKTDIKGARERESASGEVIQRKMGSVSSKREKRITSKQQY